MTPKRIRRLIDSTIVQAPPRQQLSFIQLQRLQDPTTDTNSLNEENDVDPSSRFGVQLAPPIRRIPSTLIAYNQSSHGPLIDGCSIPFH